MAEISGDKGVLQRLREELKHLKSEVATSKKSQKKKDRLEKDYLNSQTRFKTIFDRSSLGNKLIDADLKVIKVNKALIDLLGYSKKELVGSRITDIAHPNFAENWKILQHELWTNKKPSFSIDTCIVTKDKSVIWCHVTSILFEDNGERLGYTILEDITKRKTLEIHLEEANNRELLFQQQLLEVTVETQERERARIGEDLHNSLWQTLYGVTLRLDQIKLENPQGQKDNILAIKSARNILSECIAQSKRISQDLKPPILEDFGLKEAVQELCKQYSRSIRFKTHFTGLHKRLPRHLETALFRVVQELMMNVVKHAGASACSIELKVSKNEIFLRVEDNGRGFDVLKAEPGGIGMLSVKSKLHILKGELDVSSKPDQGTTVNIVLPANR